MHIKSCTSELTNQQSATSGRLVNHAAFNSPQLHSTSARHSCQSCCLDAFAPWSQAFAGIVTVSVGHCHPKVVAAVDKQNHLLQHTTNIYLNNEIAQYAQELTAKMPGNLKVS